MQNGDDFLCSLYTEVTEVNIMFLELTVNQPWQTATVNCCQATTYQLRMALSCVTFRPGANAVLHMSQT